jgi:hypothetical protein
MVEVQSAKDERAAVAAAKKIEAHREKDRKYQRARRQASKSADQASKSADIGRVLPKSADVDRHRTTSTDAAANPPPAAGPPSAEPPGIESVDKMVEVAEQGLTDQRKSPPIPPFKESVSFLPLFADSSNPEEKKEVDTRARGLDLAVLFAKFWQAYPHKVGKRDAANRFKQVLKSGIVGIDDLMSGLARYVAKTDDRPWCNPSTWLNGGRWDDQPAVANGAANGRGNGSNRDGIGTNHPKNFAEYAHQLVTEIARDRAARDRAG